MEVQDRQAFRFRDVPELQASIGDRGEGAFRPHHHLRQINDRSVARGVNAVDVVTSDAPEDFGEAPVNFACRLIGDIWDATVDLPFSVGERHLAFQLRGIKRLERCSGPVSKHNRHLLDLVDGLAVDDRVRATRVIAHRATDVGSRRRAWIGGEVLAGVRDLAVQFVDSDARLSVDPSFFTIDLDDIVHVLREIHHYPSVNGLPRQSSSTASGEHGNTRG